MIAAKSDFRNINWQSALQVIPSTWVLTPLLGNKAPYRSGWQTEAPLAREVILSDLLSGKAQGVGIRTGIISGGLVAIDLDGESAHQYVLDHLSGGEKLPKTVAFTSGRPGRSQHLYSIPQQYWDAIQTKKLKTGANGGDGKPEQVELRWDGCQSVLPPSAHPTTGEYRWVNNCSPAECEIAPAPAWMIEKMLVEVSTPQANYSHSSPQGAWTDIEWALSYLNATAPSRADDYDDWLAVGMALHSVDDSLLAEWDKWSQQSSKYRSGDCEKRWKSFKRSGKNIGSLAHMAKQDGWTSPFKKNQEYRPDKVVSLSFWNKNGNSGNPPQQNSSAYDKVKELIKSGLSQAQLTGALTEFSLSSGLQLGGLKTLAKEIEGELTSEASCADDSKEFNRLIDYRDQTLDLNKIFPAKLADALNTKAKSDRLDPAYPYSYLWSAVGINLGAHIAIEAKEGSSLGDTWKEFPIYFNAVIAPPSHGKSNAMNAMHNPVKQQQRQEQTRYKEEQKRLKELINAWQEKSKEEKELLEDSDENPKVYEKKIKEPEFRLINGGSPEGAFRRIASLPSGAGAAFALDELVRILSLDQYKSGGGDSRQILMELWNGPSSETFQRSDLSNNISFDNHCVNIVGGSQPTKFKKVSSDPDDGDGLVSRFLVTQAKTPEDFAVWSDTKVNLDEHLKGTYESLRNLHYKLRELAFEDAAQSILDGKYVLLKFDSEAAERWHKWWEHLRSQQMRFEHENPAFFGYLGKMLNQTLRLALGLHCLELVYEEKSSPLVVGLATLERAITCAKFHIGQFRLLQANNDESDNLPAQLAKIYQYAGRKGVGVSAAQVQNTVFKRLERKPALAKIREWFHQLEATGKACLEGAGSNLKLIVNKIVGIPTTSEKRSDSSTMVELPAVRPIQELEIKGSDNSDISPPPLLEERGQADDPYIWTGDDLDHPGDSSEQDSSELSEKSEDDASSLAPPEDTAFNQASELLPEEVGTSDVVSAPVPEASNSETEPIPSGTGFGMVPEPRSSKKKQVGDRVLYIGEKYRQRYGGTTLTVSSVDWAFETATCQEPDGRYTTHLPLSDLTNTQPEQEE